MAKQRSAPQFVHKTEPGNDDLFIFWDKATGKMAQMTVSEFLTWISGKGAGTVVIPLSVSLAHSDVSATGGTDGSITANGSGGTAPYTYNLNGGPYQASNIFSGLAIGPYEVGIKDAANATANASVTIGQPSQPTPTLNAYYGWKATKTTLTAAEIQAGTGVAHATGADITADYKANTQPQFLWFAEKASEPVKTKWYGSDDNNGNIGTDQDLFGAPIIVGEWRFYITEYQTQNTETTIQFRKA
ncbi:SprB repeat-containing protein [Rufibacter soli]